MAVSMYQASVPVFRHMLGSLNTLLDKAAAHAAAKGYDPGNLVRSRLTPDMMPLAQQGQVATNHATGGAARLAGLEPPVIGEDERTIEEMQARIGRAITFLDSLRPEQIDGSEDRLITLARRKEVPHLRLAGLPQVQPALSLYPMTFRGADYLFSFAMPNFYFHVVTAYAILRQAGVEIGKHDYLGPLKRAD